MYYRGESKNYGETACVPSIFRLEEYSVTFEQELYEKLVDDFGGLAIFDSIRKDSEKYEYYYLKLIGVLQHYGFQTRLLDVSSDRNIGIYFASAGNFSDDGIVYEFDENVIKEIRTTSAQSVLRKIKCVRNAEMLISRNVWEELGIKNNAKYTITNNFVVDYKTVLKDVIGTCTDNIRLNHQHGAFVMFGHIPDTNGFLTGDYKSLDNSHYFVVNKKDKFSNLIRLALDDTCICSVTMYPDSKTSMDIVAEYRKLSILRHRKIDSFQKRYKDYFENLDIKNLKLKDNITEKIYNDSDYIMRCKEAFYLLSVEFVDYCNYSEEEESLLAYNNLIQAIRNSL